MFNWNEFFYGNDSDKQKIPTKVHYAKKLHLHLHQEHKIDQIFFQASSVLEKTLSYIFRSLKPGKARNIRVCSNWTVKEMLTRTIKDLKKVYH